MGCMRPIGPMSYSRPVAGQLTMTPPSLSRREVLKAGLAAGVLAPSWARAAQPEERPVSNPVVPITPRADSMILIWLPGGMAQTDLWDPKRHTPFDKGMKGSELLGTCPSIPTAADGVRIG